MRRSGTDVMVCYPFTQLKKYDEGFWEVQGFCSKGSRGE